MRNNKLNFEDVVLELSNGKSDSEISEIIKKYLLLGKLTKYTFEKLMDFYFGDSNSYND